MVMQCVLFIKIYDERLIPHWLKFLYWENYSLKIIHTSLFINHRCSLYVKGKLNKCLENENHFKSRLKLKSATATHINNTGILSSPIYSNKAANGEARVAVLLTIFHIIAPCHWHVVNDPEKKSN